MTLLSNLHCNPSKSLIFQRFCSPSRIAHKLFDGSSQRNATTSINRSIDESSRRNSPARSLAIFKSLQLGFYCRNMDKDKVTLCIALKACRGDPKRGSQIHGFSITSGFTSIVCVSNAIMGMYCKAGRFRNALCIFENLVDPDVVSWNTILSGFDDNRVALNFVVRMKSAGVVFDAFTYSTAAKICVGSEGFRLGLQLQSNAVKSALVSDVVVGNSFIIMYTRSESFRDARRVFDEMPFKDMISWNSLLSGLSQGGKFGFETVVVFRDMMRETKVAELAMEMKPVLSGSYVQLYNIYAEKGQWEKAAEIRKKMRKNDVRKEAGFSWIDVGDSEGSLTMQGFSSGDKSHPKSDEIYRMVEIIGLEMNLDRKVAVC